MNILITGANGQLGKDCNKVLSPQNKIACCDIPSHDITDPAQVAHMFSVHQPEIVINCAAYTAVDGCESDSQRCMEVNASGPQNLATQCDKSGCKLVQISTDYVFDGTRPVPDPYLENDQPNPLSTYGKSKLAGDEAVQGIENHLIIRTAWLYGFGGRNFLKTMLRLAVTDPKRTITVVDDQHGSLTWSYRLAQQIALLLDKSTSGIVHATAEGNSTWYTGARYFLDAMGVEYSITPCTTSQYPTPAPRPANSILENNRLKKEEMNIMADWKEDIDLFVSRHKEELLREANQ